MKKIGGSQPKSRVEIVWLGGGRRRLPPVIDNATPLRWHRPPHRPNFDGLDSTTDHNQLVDDDSGGASASVSRNSNNPMPPPRHPWFGLHCSGVDTTLRLRPPGKIITTNKRQRNLENTGKRPANADDQHQDQKKRRTRDSTFQERYQTQISPTSDLDHVEVDTTLRLSTSLTRNSNIPPYVAPTIPITPPLRWFQLVFFDGVEDDDVDTKLSMRPPCTTNKKSRTTPKAKRRESPSKKKCNVIDAAGDENQRPLIPIEEIPRLHETLISRGAAQPVFLYRKKLEESDVKRCQNRVLVTRRERLMEFLSMEEAAAVDGGRSGLRINAGIDGGGNVYEKLKVNRWGKVVVINSDWGRVVEANDGRRGDVVEIWGYRESGKPCLAFNFRREREIRDIDDVADAASSSSS